MTYCSHGQLRYKGKPGPGNTSARLGPIPSQDSEALLPGTVVLLSPEPHSRDESALLRDFSFVVVEAMDGPHALLLSKVGGGRAMVSRQRCLTRFPDEVATSPHIAWEATGPADGDTQLESEPFGLFGLVWTLRVTPERAKTEDLPQAGSANACTSGQASGADPPKAAAAAVGADSDDLAASLQVEGNVELLRCILGDAFDERMLRDKTSRETLREILVGAGVLPAPTTGPGAAAPGELDKTLAEGTVLDDGGAAILPTVSSSAPGADPCGENNGVGGDGTAPPETRCSVAAGGVRERGLTVSPDEPA